MTQSCRVGPFLLAISLASVSARPAAAQVDQPLARAYFEEAAALCEREGGRLWGVSLCGPIALVDAVTHTSATSQPAPEAPPPPLFGYANTAVDWGGTRWSTVVWRTIPASNAQDRGRLLIHELFHRIQPQLGLQGPDGQNPHLDTLEGRYWLRLEWRALGDALRLTGVERTTAIGDALAFRARRHSLFPEAAEQERRMEINEGLAQYTGTVVAAGSLDSAAADVRAQLARYEQGTTFVRDFPYPSGAAYGLLLDAWSPGWTRQVTRDECLASRLMSAARVAPSTDPAAAAQRYGGGELRAAEEKRDVEQKARVAALRRVFVDGPVLVLPRSGKNTFSFTTAGATPIPGAGTVYPDCRVTADWGSLEAGQALMAQDMSAISVPAPGQPGGTVIKGDGWVLRLGPGWVLRPGARAGDYQVVRQPQ